MKHIIHKTQNIQGSMGWISKTVGKIFGGGSSEPDEYDLAFLERIKYWEGIMKDFYAVYKESLAPRLNPPKYGDLNMILSNSFIEMIDQLCEGPIGGLCNENGIILNNAELMRGIYLDGAAIKVSTKYEWPTSPGDVFNENAVINNPVAFKGISIADRINTYPKESNFLSMSKYMINHLRDTFTVTVAEDDFGTIGVDQSSRDYRVYDVLLTDNYGYTTPFGYGKFYPKAGSNGYVYTNSGGYDNVYLYTPWLTWSTNPTVNLQQIPREENVMYNVWPLGAVPKYINRKISVTLDLDAINNITYSYETQKSIAYFEDRSDIYANEIISSFEEILSLYNNQSTLRKPNKYQRIFIDGLMKRRCGDNWDKKDPQKMYEQFLRFQNVEIGYAGLIMIKAPTQTETQSTVRLNKLSYDPRYADYAQLQKDYYTKWYFENLSNKDLSNLEFHYITNPDPNITLTNKPSLFAKDMPGVRVHSFLVPEIDENGYYVYSPNTYPNMVGFILIEVIDGNLFAFRMEEYQDDYEFFLDSFYWDPDLPPQFLSQLDNRYKTEPFLKGRINNMMADCRYTNQLKKEINKITALSLIQIET